MKKIFPIFIMTMFFTSTFVFAQEDPRNGKNCPCRIVEDTANRQIKLVDRNGSILKIYAHAYNNHNIELYQNDKEFYIMRNNSGIYQVTVFDIATGRTVRTYTVRPTELDNWIR